VRKIRQKVSAVTFAQMKMIRNHFGGELYKSVINNGMQMNNLRAFQTAKAPKQVKESFFLVLLKPCYSKDC